MRAVPACHAGWAGRGQALTFGLEGTGQRARAKFKAKEGRLPVGGRGRPAGRAGREEACLNWRRGDSPSSPWSTACGGRSPWSCLPAVSSSSRHSADALPSFLPSSSPPRSLLSGPLAVPLRREASAERRPCSLRGRWRNNARLYFGAIRRWHQMNGLQRVCVSGEGEEAEAEDEGWEGASPVHSGINRSSG